MSWAGWLLLGMLSVVGAGRFVLDLRQGKLPLAVLRLATVVVLGYGVVCNLNGRGAGLWFGLALPAAMAVQAQRSWADARTARHAGLSAPTHVGIALGNVVLLAAAVLGATAFWARHGR